MLFYVTPWCRSPSYLLGFYLGCLYLEFKQYRGRLKSQSQVFNFLIDNKRKLQNPKVYVVLYITSVGCMICLLIIQSESNTFFGSSLFSSLEKFLNCLCLSLFLLPNLLGSSDFVIKFLSYPLLGKLATVQYCTLLMSSWITQIVFSSASQMKSFDALNLFLFFLLILILTLIFSALLKILAQQPFESLFVVLYNQKKRPENPKSAAPRGSKPLGDGARENED